MTDTLLAAGFQQFTLPSYLTEQKLLEEFYSHASQQKENKRIFLAEELLKRWQETVKTLELFPAVPDRHDFWYLIQLFSQNNHVDKNGNFIHFSLSTQKKIWVENFLENENIFLESSTLLSTFLSKNDFEDFPNRNISRKKFDVFLDQHTEKILTLFGLQGKFSLRLLHFDEYLRIGNLLGLGQQKYYTFLEGYRRNSQEELLSLCAGNVQFGGKNFIDAWDCSISHKDTLFRLVIEEL